MKLKAMAVAIGALTVLGMGAGAAFAGAPVSTQTQTISLDSTNPQGVDTGYVVNKAQPVGVSATGVVGFAEPPLGGCGDFCSTNPDGVLVFVPPLTLPCASDCLLPGAPVGELIGKIGANGSWFPVGSNSIVSYAGTVGHLYLAYNDDFFADNVGTYTVSLSRHAAVLAP